MPSPAKDPIPPLPGQPFPANPDVDKHFHQGMDAIRLGTRNLIKYYTSVNEQQASERKMLKDANECLWSSVQQLASENTALKKRLADNVQELKNLMEDRKRWEDEILKIRSAFLTLNGPSTSDRGETDA
ncbi:hypothetical protein BJX66DRAFT_317055 [Aspergillus keveii]|uniref:Uncharacterized protein n=1 Tax=Aspergillus keveii TaxID=714993 RepID=A0ABR4FLS1_9EURO